MIDYRGMKANTDDFFSLWRSYKPTICKVHGLSLSLKRILQSTARASVLLRIYAPENDLLGHHLAYFTSYGDAIPNGGPEDCLVPAPARREAQQMGDQAVGGGRAAAASPLEDADLPLDPRLAKRQSAQTHREDCGQGAGR